MGCDSTLTQAAVRATAGSLRPLGRQQVRSGRSGHGILDLRLHTARAAQHQRHVELSAR